MPQTSQEACCWAMERRARSGACNQVLCGAHTPYVHMCESMHCPASSEKCPDRPISESDRSDLLGRAARRRSWREIGPEIGKAAQNRFSCLQSPEVYGEVREKGQSFSTLSPIQPHPKCTAGHVSMCVCVCVLSGDPPAVLMLWSLQVRRSWHCRGHAGLMLHKLKACDQR